MSTVPLQAMPLPVSLAFGAAGAALVLLGVRDVWRALRYRYRRPTQINRLDDRSGRVTVSGVARRADDALTAPLSGRNCLGYAWRTAEFRTMRSLDGSIDNWGERGASGRDAVPFVVEDGTGSVLVDPTNAELRLAEEWVRDPVDAPDLPDEDPSARDLIEDLLGIRTHSVRYYESRLDEGETVTVRGRVAPDAESFAARRIALSISGSDTLVEDATPGAASGRSLRTAAMSLGSGLFVLAAVAVFVLLA